MRELRLTDGELQKLIASALRRKLAKAGFKTGTPSDASSAFYFPLNLQLCGDVSVVRYEDGTWVFTQDDAVIADRLAETFILHAVAIETNERAMGLGGKRCR